MIWNDQLKIERQKELGSENEKLRSILEMFGSEKVLVLASRTNDKCTRKLVDEIRMKRIDKKY